MKTITFNAQARLVKSRNVTRDGVAKSYGVVFKHQAQVDAFLAKLRKEKNPDGTDVNLVGTDNLAGTNHKISQTLQQFQKIADKAGFNSIGAFIHARNTFSDATITLTVHEPNDVLQDGTISTGYIPTIDVDFLTPVNPLYAMMDTMTSNMSPAQLFGLGTAPVQASPQPVAVAQDNAEDTAEVVDTALVAEIVADYPQQIENETPRNYTKRVNAYMDKVADEHGDAVATAVETALDETVEQ